jgi:hypothetical protein
MGAHFEQLAKLAAKRFGPKRAIRRYATAQ